MRVCERGFVSVFIVVVVHDRNDTMTECRSPTFLCEIFLGHVSTSLVSLPFFNCLWKRSGLTFCWTLVVMVLVVVEVSAAV